MRHVRKTWAWRQKAPLWKVRGPRKDGSSPLRAPSLHLDGPMQEPQKLGNHNLCKWMQMEHMSYFLVVLHGIFLTLRILKGLILLEVSYLHHLFKLQQH